jgi:hypothetical protein
MPDTESASCATWNELRDALESFVVERRSSDFWDNLSRASWVFRGHRSAAWKLESSIARLGEEAGICWFSAESQMMRLFSERMCLYGRDRIGDDKPARLLAFMQHYGVPTRMLDFTRSPWVALFFALESRVPSGDAEIWAIDSQAVASKKSAELDSQGLRPWDADQIVLRDRGGILPSARRAEGCKPWPNMVAAYQPVEHSLRSSSQHGLFLYNADPTHSFEESLMNMMDGSTGWLRRIRIGASVREEALRRLHGMNIHRLSLFPDMEGLGGFVRQHVELFGRPNDPR